MNIWLYETLSTKIYLYNTAYLSYPVINQKHKKLREAKLRLVIKTDIKDISSV